MLTSKQIAQNEKLTEEYGTGRDQDSTRVGRRLASVELLPCPFCGTDNVSVTDCMSEDGEWIVVCAECKSGGAFKRNKSDAITAWNTRADTSEQKGAIK